MPPWAYSDADSFNPSLATTSTEPAFANSIAARKPATPAPMTRKSVVIVSKVFDPACFHGSPEVMGQVKLLDAVRLPEGAVCEVKLGDQTLAVCHAEGAFYVVSGVCPHAGGPLGHGALHGHALVCPWHAWEFDCRTGECDFNATRLSSYPVKVADGGVWVELNA